MFSTKKDAEKWIKDFATDMNLRPGRYDKYWRIFDEDGYPLTEERIWEIEDKANAKQH